MVDPVVIREFDYSLPVHWFWPLLGVFILAWINFRIYFKERGSCGTRTRLSLALIRTLICTMAILALMNWHVVLKKFRRSELIVCLDVSASLQHLDQLPNPKILDSETEKPSRFNVLLNRLRNAGPTWLERLENRFDLNVSTIGQDIQPIKYSSFEDLLKRLHATGSESNIDRSLERLLKSEQLANPAGIVLFTDGLDSNDPRFSKTIEIARAINVPVFPIGLGEKRPANDVQVEELQANRKVFLNDLVEFQVSIAADGFANQKARIQLIDDQAQELVAEKEVTITGNQFRDLVRFRVRMANEGKRLFVARLTHLDGEFDTDNNQKSIEIEIDANQIKVLLAANYPSREFHFLKQFLGRDAKVHPDSPAEFAKNRIQLDTFLQQGDIEYTSVDQHAIKIFPVTKKQLFEYDVVIFCDLKPNWAGNVAGGLGNNELSNLQEFVEERGGGLVLIAGPMYTPQAYTNSPIANLFPVDIKALSSPQIGTDASASFDRSYTIRKTTVGSRFLPLDLGSENEAKSFRDFPGTYWFASSNDLKPQAIVLAELVAGNQSYPGIVTQTVGNGNVLYHAFPETYRWRYRTSEIYFGRYWSQMIQYLASNKLTQGSQRLILETDKKQYFRNEPVQVLGHPLDQSFTKEETIQVTVRNRSNFETRVALKQADSKHGSFSALLSNLGPGSYEIYLSNNVEINDSFEIVDASRENQRQPLNEIQLTNLAKQTGGQFLKIDELDQLEELLPKQQLIEIGGEPPWVFWQQGKFAAAFGGIFLLLISVEWLLRKRVAML